MSHGRSVIEAQALASLRDRIVRDMRYPAGAWSDSDGCATSEPTKAPKRCLSNVVLPLMNDPSYGIRGNDFTGQDGSSLKERVINYLMSIKKY